MSRFTIVARRIAVISVALVALLVARPALAEPRSRVPDICAGCLASVTRGSEAGSAPAPLLVTLHGDWGQMAPDLHAAWERLAAPRGIALLSLTCPVDLGCKRSWWGWNGDPAWLSAQIDRLAARVAIDRDRVWLVGWSGGAAYMGMHTQELEGRFAALVFHGGGVWPLRAGCAAEKAPVVFLAGDQNPLHPHVLELRKHYERCGNEITFTLLRGAEHAAEWTALDKHGVQIIDLLTTKRRHALAAPPSTVEQAAPPSSEPAVVQPAPLARAPEPVPPRSGCSCDVAHLPDSSAAVGASTALALALLALRRFRSRPRSRSPS